MLCPGMASGIPSSANLPRRGPMIQTTETAIRPPTTWITAAPPGSTNPGMPKFALNCANHPAPHTQCANKGKMKPASTALARQIGASRQRSEPPLSGTVAARPAASISRHRVSDLVSPAGSEGSMLRPLGKNGAAPSQSQCTPPAVKECAAPPANPAHENPNRTKTMAEMPSAQSVASMAWAAERERPSP